MTPFQINKERIIYFTGVYNKLKVKADELEARLKKAEDMGCDQPDNKFYKTYLQVKEDWKRTLDQMEEYKVDDQIEMAKEIFNV